MHYNIKKYRQLDHLLFSDCSEREVFFQLLKDYGKTVPPEVQNHFKAGLNIGSVSGFYLAAFQGFGMKAIGLNPDQKAIRYIRKEAVYSPYVNYWLGKEVQLLKAEMGALPLKDGSVDLISVMTGTFSHVEKGRHESVLEELARVLEKERVLIISDWNLACERQDFFGLYNPEEQDELRVNHLGYPHLLEALPKLNFTLRSAYLHSGRKMYAALSTRN